ADALGAIEQVISHINESTAFFVDQPALLQRIHALGSELDAELAKSSADAGESMVVRRLNGPAPSAPAPADPATEVPAIQAEPAAALQASAAPLAEAPLYDVFTIE